MIKIAMITQSRAHRCNQLSNRCYHCRNEVRLILVMWPFVLRLRCPCRLETSLFGENFLNPNRITLNEMGRVTNQQ